MTVIWLSEKPGMSERSEKRDKSVPVLTFVGKLISSALSNAITTPFPNVWINYYAPALNAIRKSNLPTQTFL